MKEIKDTEIYSGDCDWINGQIDVRNRMGKYGKPWDLYDFKRLISHIFNNKDRQEAPELIKHNELRDDIKVVNGSESDMLKEIDALINLNNIQEQLNTNHRRDPKDNVLNWGRGARIPMRLGVSQLLLNPRNKENQPMIDEWEKELTALIKREYGDDALIVFHYNETSCGCHFVSKYYKTTKNKDGVISKIDINQEKKKKDKDPENLTRIHRNVEEMVEKLAKKHNRIYKQEAATEQSIQRDIRTKGKIMAKVEAGETLSKTEIDFITRKIGDLRPEKKLKVGGRMMPVSEAADVFYKLYKQKKKTLDELKTVYNDPNLSNEVVFALLDNMLLDKNIEKTTNEKKDKEQKKEKIK